MGKNYMTYMLIFLLVVMFAFLIYEHQSNKVGYIDNTELFTKFDGTKELEKSSKAALMYHYNQIDSLNKVMEAVQNLYKKTPTSELELQYFYSHRLKDSISQIYQQKQSELTQALYKQVWSTLNEYVIQYGKEKGFKFIYGANGTGSIMYASERANITADVLKFSNKKYSGK
jgi:outer membrane protein